MKLQRTGVSGCDEVVPCTSKHNAMPGASHARANYADKQWDGDR